MHLAAAIVGGTIGLFGLGGIVMSWGNAGWFYFPFLIGVTVLAAAGIAAKGVAARTLLAIGLFRWLLAVPLVGILIAIIVGALNGHPARDTAMWLAISISCSGALLIPEGRWILKRVKHIHQVESDA